MPKKQIYYFLFIFECLFPNLSFPVSSINKCNFARKISIPVLVQLQFENRKMDDLTLDPELFRKYNHTGTD